MSSPSESVWEQAGVLIEHDCCLISLSDEREAVDERPFSALTRLMCQAFGVEKFMLHVQGRQFYEDVAQALECSDVRRWNLLVPTQTFAEEVARDMPRLRRCHIGKIAVKRDLRMRLTPLRCSVDALEFLAAATARQSPGGEGALDDTAFDDAALDLACSGPEYERVREDVLGLCRSMVDATRESVMGLLAVYFGESGALTASRYHSFGGYEVDLGDDSLVARPAISTPGLGRFRRSDVARFEQLINSPRVRESDLQRFFEEHPLFLRGVNPSLCRVYPQVFLKKTGPGALIPDFVIEPVAGKWCDLLDIKLPSVDLVTGPANRRRLTTALCEGIAQMEEYQRFFEDPRNRERFRELMRAHGALDADCYYPRLNLVVGMDPSQLDHDAIRRQLMTRYRDVHVVTYSQLLDHARENLLI